MPLPYWLRFGSGAKPNPTLMQALVADSKCYSAPSGLLAIASNATYTAQTAAMALWNPAASGVNAYVYGVTITSDVAGVRIRFGHVTADPALGTAVTPVCKFRTGSLPTSAISAETAITASMAIPSVPTDFYMTGLMPILLDDDYSAMFLTPGTGTIVHFMQETLSTATNVGCTMLWAEFSTS